MMLTHPDGVSGSKSAALSLTLCWLEVYIIGRVVVSAHK